MITELFPFDPYDPRCTRCDQALTKDHSIGQSQVAPGRTMYQMRCTYCKTIVGFVIDDQFDPAAAYVKVSIIREGKANV